MSQSDKLFETAFDGGETEVRNLRQSLSQSDAQEFDSLVALKSDLKKLGDIPECQLTTDHLRQAFLNRPPAPVAKRPASVWAWTPLAAAAALGLMVFIKGGDKLSPSVDKSESLAVKTTSGDFRSKAVLPDRSSGSVASSMPKSTAANDVVDSTADEAFVASIGTSNRSPEARHRRETTRSSGGSGETLVASDVVSRTANELFTADYRTIASGPTGSAESSFDAADKESNGAETQKEPVVIVSDHANPRTGAAEAQEVSRPSDVVFGG